MYIQTCVHQEIRHTRKFLFTAYFSSMRGHNHYYLSIPTQNVSMYDDIAGYIRISQDLWACRRMCEDIARCKRISQDVWGYRRHIRTRKIDEDTAGYKRILQSVWGYIRRILGWGGYRRFTRITQNAWGYRRIIRTSHIMRSRNFTRIRQHVWEYHRIVRNRIFLGGLRTFPLSSESWGHKACSNYWIDPWNMFNNML